MKKIVVLLLIALLILAMLPTVALADRTIDISTYTTACIYYLSGNNTYSLTGTAINNVGFEFGDNTTVILDNVHLNCFHVLSALQFFGGNNTIILKGTSTLTAGSARPGIKIDPGTTLNIQGDGTLIVTGGTTGSAIAGYSDQSGVINITGGTIYAQGRGGAYDIGYNGSDNGTFIISENANVLVKSGNTLPVATHVLETYTNASQMPSEFSLPSGWTYPISRLVVNQPPAFTNATVNTSQDTEKGYPISSLSINDPNGASDIASCVVTSGSLPSGITLNHNGTFNGVASENGTFNATITVTDSGGLSDTTDLEVRVHTCVTSVLLAKYTHTLVLDSLNESSFDLMLGYEPYDVTIQDIVWNTSPTGVVTVTGPGIVTAVSVGVADVTGTVRDTGGGAMGATCRVTVEQAATGIDIVRETATIINGDPVKNTTTLTANVLPSNAKNKDVSWQSSDTSIATVDTSGVVTAKKAGTVTITATADDTRGGTFQDPCTVTVEQKLNSVTLSESSRTLTVNSPSDNNFSLSAGFVPSDATITSIEWESSNTDVVTVDQNGVVTAVGIGNAEIVAKVTDTTDTVTASGICNVTVVKQAESIVFVNQTAIMNMGEVASIDSVIPYTVLPVDTANKLVTITSSNTGVATISGSMVTAVSEGVTWLTVQSVENPSAKAEIALYVKDPTPPATVSDKHEKITGRLVDDMGNPLVGYTITLFSDPMTTTTDSNGVFSFTGVSYDEHTLIINSPTFTELGRFALNFTRGSVASSSVDNDTKDIGITYKTDTVEVSMPITLTHDGVFAGTISFIKKIQEYNEDPDKKVLNPCTGYFSP